MKIYKTWTDFKTIVLLKKLNMQYNEDTYRYTIWGSEENDLYKTDIYKSDPAGADQVDFETNYKDDANKPIIQKAPDGKDIFRTESLPKGCTIYFTCAGDTAEQIGGGKTFIWDFANSDDDITAPTGYKRKRIEFNFKDSVWMKEGTLYFHNALKGSYVDVKVICPAGQYYYKNDGTPALAEVDTPVSHYINKCYFQGSVPMGDEFNTETCSNEIPANYKFWIEITVPDTDSTSNGYINLEMYRVRTEILV